MVQVDLRKNVAEICDGTLKFKLANYEKVYKDFSKFFHEEELQRSLDQKADMSMLDALNHSKVSTVQHNSLIAKVEDLNQKLRHLSVLQLEMSTNVIPYKQQKQNFMDSHDENKMIVDLERVKRNATIVSQWINDA